MTRVLIADNDVDSHELMDDLIEINFRDAQIDHALTKESFLEKIGEIDKAPNLVIFNFDLDNDNETGIIHQLRERYPDLLDRIVFIASDDDNKSRAALGKWPVLSRPFSLDHFEEVVKKVCVR